MRVLNWSDYRHPLRGGQWPAIGCLLLATAMVMVFSAGCRSPEADPGAAASEPGQNFNTGPHDAANPGTAAPLRIERDLAYGTRQAPLLLDLYLPPNSASASSARRPAVLMIHGGSWQRGNRERMARNAEAIARAGFIVANIEYSLAPDFQFPAQLEDCRAAVSWLRQNAERYGLDPARIGAFGFSAGGHLALLLATAQAEQNPDATAVQAVVAGAPPVDLLAFPENSAMRRLLGVRRRKAPQLYRDASPINHISADDPPTFLYHGRYDWIVPVDQSRRMAERLEAAGVLVELFETKQGHLTAATDNAVGLTRAIEFLQKHLARR